MTRLIQCSNAYAYSTGRAGCGNSPPRLVHKGFNTCGIKPFGSSLAQSCPCIALQGAHGRDFAPFVNNSAQGAEPAPSPNVSTKRMVLDCISHVHLMVSLCCSKTVGSISAPSPNVSIKRMVLDCIGHVLLMVSIYCSKIVLTFFGRNLGNYTKMKM